jgi:chromate transporter
MNLLLLYLLLLKATSTSFSGLTSLPVVRHDLVQHYHVLTDRQLNAAVAAGRATPGPYGLYVVSVGYFVAGVPGACAGWLASITPAFSIIVLLRYLGRRAERPSVKSAIQCVMLAAVGLVITATIPLARDAIVGPLQLAIALGSFLFLAFSRYATFWVILAAALAGLAGALLSVPALRW